MTPPVERENGEGHYRYSDYPQAFRASPYGNGGLALPSSEIDSQETEDLYDGSHWPQTYQQSSDKTYSAYHGADKPTDPTPAATYTGIGGGGYKSDMSTATSTEYRGVQMTDSPSTLLQSPSESAGSSMGTPGKTELAPGPNGTQIPSSSNDRQMPRGRMAAAILLPILFLALLGLLLFLFLRKRRRSRAALLQEMKASQEPMVATYTAPPASPPPSAVHSPGQPVILSPMNPAVNASYYTGLDTSEVVSVHDDQQHTAAGGFAFGHDHQDEPPPPYRPRSVAAISREPSTRQNPETRMSQMHLMAEVLSEDRDTHLTPYGDAPDGDDDGDAVSDISEPTGDRRDDEEMSAVSDLSYQDEATVHHAV